MPYSHRAALQIVVDGRVWRRIEVAANQQRHVFNWHLLESLYQQVSLHKLDV
eukprot:CAMPEP_0170572344 /NCGR_PEP_ID=MMETSP0224-20130122/2165_1 /TAXON_ID=285029 /ORGANISM="Togula jolla, Strain CCCM 725" /LENGTH=51 /DNA_ID=CAMNT_0010894825 /DNA_START=611 /DNA_END=766 /DNA_ORIENTATION=-